jgi:hypothetical protein
MTAARFGDVVTDGRDIRDVTMTVQATTTATTLTPKIAATTRCPNEREVGG